MNKSFLKLSTNSFNIVDMRLRMKPTVKIHYCISDKLRNNSLPHDQEEHCTKTY